MKSINRVSFLGHIVADPQVKTTKSGKKVATFAIATNNEWFDHNGELNKTVDFHRIVAWDKQAETCEKFLGKGLPIYLEGRLTNRSYEDKSGVKHYTTEVVLSNLNILKWKDQKESVEVEEVVA